MTQLTFLQQLIPSLDEVSWAPSFLKKNKLLSTEVLCHQMMASDGEYSSFAFARQILDRYEGMADEEKLRFFDQLLAHYDLDANKLVTTSQAYAKNPNADNLSKVFAASESDQRAFFQRLNQVPGGTHGLVKMRADILRLSHSNHHLKKLDVGLASLLRSWFNRGFLEMRSIDWTTPANVLEKIIRYESVHEISSWRELRARLEPKDRLCFAFFHPSMNDEPLVFVEVALTNRLPDSIEEILAADRKQISAEVADYAIFYSISNCHRGLAAVSFGNFLIKQVAIHLQHKLSSIKHFATLSPVPGFNAWWAMQSSSDKDLNSRVAKYLIKAKTEDGRPLDPVARFHLKNGASLGRINLDADISDKGLRQSEGVMVNYLYNLQKVVSNHEAYQSQQAVHTTAEIEKMANY